MVGQDAPSCNGARLAKAKNANNDMHFLVAPGFVPFRRVLKNI
jgi:hypothetical protein